MSNSIQVFEHGVLRLGEKGFRQSHFDALVHYSELHKGQFFVPGYERIHFNQYVGVIQVGNLTIEVLPKAEREAEEDKGKWHRVLIEMLHRCGSLRLESVAEAHLRLRYATLFDLYIKVFLREAEDIIHHGLVRKYRRSTANMSVLKGRLIFSEHLKRNLIHREHFYTSHQCYDYDNVWNRILKQALQIIQKTSNSQFLAAEAKRLLLNFEYIADVNTASKTFRRLQYNRNTEGYRRGISLAELIILSFAPDVRYGKRNVVAILFDMNELFERYVYIMLKNAQSHYADVVVSAQKSKKFWSSERASMHLRPDIMLTLGSGQSLRRIILDTKWKMPGRYKPADEDLRQMYAYSLQFGAEESYLIYPCTGGEERTWGRYESSENIRHVNDHGCGLWFVDLFDENGNLSANIGKKMLDWFLRESLTLRE